MEKKKYGKYISREIIDSSKYSQITAPVVKYRGDRGNKDMTFEWSCITKPVVMDDEPEINEFDQYLFFAGSNVNDYNEFEAEIELPLGKEGKKQIINEPKMVLIPGGLARGPLNFKNIRKPVVFMSLNFSAKYSNKWAAPKYENYLAKPIIDNNSQLSIQAIIAGVPYRYQTVTTPTMMAWSKKMGLNGNLSMGYMTIKAAHNGMEPLHAHRNLDQWVILLGGDPLNVADFDGDIAMIYGEERELQILDSTCVAHMPPGVIHYSTDHLRVGKPFVEIIAVSTGDYFSERPKVIYSKEANGDIMVSRGREWEIDLLHPRDCDCADCKSARSQRPPI
jgi:hypothetical protein